MGMVNYVFLSMDQIADVEAKGYYAEHVEKGEEPRKAFAPGNDYKLLAAFRSGGGEQMAAYEAGIWKKIQ